MSLWHGYPQAPGAHPERPWWVRGSRSDGWILRWGLPGNRGWFAQDPGGRGHDLLGTFDEVMATIDREHPMPLPEPRCGQVWVSVAESFDAMITSTFVNMMGTRTVFCEDWHCFWPKGEEPEAPSFPGAWPPPRAVLVAGPGAPWAPA